MDGGVAITLPGGLLLDGVRHRDALLRAPTGEDEAAVLEAVPASPAHQTTVLLARCLARLGPLAPVPEHAVRSLAVGDREALLLHLRRLLVGERIACVLSCPDPACGEPMDVELAVEELLVAPYEEWPEWHSTAADGEPVRFRVPNGGDLEAVAASGVDLDEAARLLVSRCVDGAAPAAALEVLPPVFAELDPQAEIRLAVACPSCGLPFGALLDAADFLFRELGWSRRGVYRDVHLLARAYGWSERDILALPARKRRLYLELLAEAS